MASGCTSDYNTASASLLGNVHLYTLYKYATLGCVIAKAQFWNPMTRPLLLGLIKNVPNHLNLAISGNMTGYKMFVM